MSRANAARRIPRAIALGGLGVGIVGIACLSYRPLALDVELQRLFRQPTSIQRIRQHQGRNLQGTVVWVEGTVGDRAPLVGAEVYELQQGVEKLWIVTTETGVQLGDRLVVRGRVQQESFDQNGVTLREYYLHELRRRSAS